MPLLGGSSSPFDEIIEKATNETKTSEDWGLIMDICDRIQSAGSKGAKEGLLSIKKRLNHRDPHVVMLAISSQAKVSKRVRMLIKKWSSEECKSDSSLSLIPALLNDLERDGFTCDDGKPSKSSGSSKTPADPNYVSSKEEEDAIAKAIQMSLQETKAVNQASSHQYQSSSSSSSSMMMSKQGSKGGGLYPSDAMGQPPPRMVKALYDFEAAESNELTFKAGEHITILEDSDMNWWKGKNHRGEGLFPSSFVTADLTAPVELEETNKSNDSKKSVQFDENVTVETVPRKEAEVVISEEKLDECLEMLKDADPTGDRPDPAELAVVEDECMRMGPLIDSELAAVDHEYNMLAEVDVKLRDALALYNQAMEECNRQLQVQMSQTVISGQQQAMGMPQQLQQQQPQSVMPPLPNGNTNNNNQGGYMPQQQMPPQQQPVMMYQQQQQPQPNYSTQQ